MSILLSSLKELLDQITPIIDFDNPKFKNKPLIEILGIALLEKYPEIKHIRKSFIFDPIILTNNDLIFEFINSNLIDLTNFNIEVVHKAIDRDGLKPHFDDYQLIKNNPKDNFDRFIHIKNKFYLYRITKEPIFTILFYKSTYNVDFTGGELCLVDEKIIPKRGEGFMISSKEAHHVNRHDGNREVTVVKLYMK